MKKSSFSEEKIISILEEGDAGTNVAELCRKYGMSDATYYNEKSIAAVLDKHKARCIVGLAHVAIGRQWRADFRGRETSQFAVSWKRRAAIASNVGPKVEKETRVVLEWTTEIAVLAKIDGLIKDPRRNPAVLEEIVL